MDSRIKIILDILGIENITLAQRADLESLIGEIKEDGAREAKDAMLEMIDERLEEINWNVSEIKNELWDD